MDLELTTSETDGVSVLAVAGEVDIYSAPQLDECMSSLINGGSGDLGGARVVLDLSEVGFLDSTGLGVVVKALKRVRENEGTLNVVVADERIAKVFRITGLDKVVELHGDRASAVAAGRS